MKKTLVFLLLLLMLALVLTVSVSAATIIVSGPTLPPGACNHPSFKTDYITRQPTCTTAGERVVSCAWCGGYQHEETIPALGHAWSGWTTAQKATCTSAGQEVNKCSRCGETQTRTIPANGSHSWSKWKVDIEPTCTHWGKQSQTCWKCGQTQTASIKPTGEHTWGDAEILLNEAGDGYVARKTCTSCGEVAEDPCAVDPSHTPTEDEEQIIAESMLDDIMDWDDYDDDLSDLVNTARSLSTKSLRDKGARNLTSFLWQHRLGIARRHPEITNDIFKLHRPLGRNITYVSNGDCTHTVMVNGKATSTAKCVLEVIKNARVPAVRCKLCGATYAFFAHGSTVISSKLDNYFSAWQSNGDGTHSCSCEFIVDGKVVPYTKTEDCSGGEATCESKAICEVCGQYYGELGHQFIAENTYPNYICGFDMVMSRCDLCNCSHAEYLANGKETCDLDNLKIKEYCWCTQYLCSDCGLIINIDQKDTECEIKDAPLRVDQSINYVSLGCPVCGYDYSSTTYDEYIAAHPDYEPEANDSYDCTHEWQVYQTKPYYCGYEVQWSWCPLCDEHTSDVVKIGEECAVTDAVVRETCTEIDYGCPVCGMTYDTKAKENAQHDTYTVTVQPGDFWRYNISSGDYGLSQDEACYATLLRCHNCDETLWFGDEFGESLYDHDWVPVAEEYPGNCDSRIVYYACAVCGKTKTEHEPQECDMVETFQDACDHSCIVLTCSRCGKLDTKDWKWKQGADLKECVWDGKTYKRVVHDENNWGIFSCYTEFPVCSVCGATLEGWIEHFEHDYQYVEPTVDGTAIYKCSICGKISDQLYNEISSDDPVHEHQLTVEVHEACGSTYSIYACQTCGYSWRDDEQVFNIENVCTPDDSVRTFVPGGTDLHGHPVCGAWKTRCTKCGEFVEDNNEYIYSHDYNFSSSTSSCTEAGVDIYACSRCGKSYEVIGNFEHDLESTGNFCDVQECGVGGEWLKCRKCGAEVLYTFPVEGEEHQWAYTGKENQVSCEVIYKEMECTICHITKEEFAETGVKCDPVPEKAWHTNDSTWYDWGYCSVCGAKKWISGNGTCDQHEWHEGTMAYFCMKCGELRCGPNTAGGSMDDLQNHYFKAIDHCTFIEYHCSNCDFVYYDYKQPEEYTHNWEVKETSEQVTCSGKGAYPETTYQCTECGEIKITDCPKEYNHDFIIVGNPPMKWYCPDCGQIGDLLG